jgi:hypothetical protein
MLLAGALLSIAGVLVSLAFYLEIASEFSGKG